MSKARDFEPDEQVIVEPWPPKTSLNNQTLEELDGVLEVSIGENTKGYLWAKLSPKSKRAIQSLITRECEKASFRELVNLGKLYNGSKKQYLDHYEERYKYLKGKIDERD